MYRICKNECQSYCILKLFVKWRKKNEKIFMNLVFFEFFFFWKTGNMCYKSRIMITYRMIHGMGILYDRYFLRLEMIAVKTLKGIISYKVFYWQKYIAMTSIRVMKMINTMYICSQSVTNLRSIFWSSEDYPVRHLFQKKR